MRIIASTIILLLIVACSVSANNQKIITVMDFETNGVSEQEMTLIIDYLSSSVSDYKDYVLIDRRQRETILNEAEFSNSGCADETCAIEIGQLLSANEMIVGSLGSVGSFYIINTKLIDVETGKTVNNVSERYTTLDEIIINSEMTIKKLFSNDKKNEISTKTTTAEIDELKTEPDYPKTSSSEDSNFLLLGIGAGTTVLLDNSWPLYYEGFPIRTVSGSFHAVYDIVVFPAFRVIENNYIGIESIWRYDSTYIDMHVELGLLYLNKTSENVLFGAGINLFNPWDGINLQDFGLSLYASYSDFYVRGLFGMNLESISSPGYRFSVNLGYIVNI